MHWILNTSEPTKASDLRSALEKAQEIYLDKSVINRPAVLEPIGGMSYKEVAPVPYPKEVVDRMKVQMGRAIDAACALANEGVVSCSISGGTHPGPNGEELDRVSVNVDEAAA